MILFVMFFELTNSMGLAMLVGMLAIAVIAIVYFIFKKVRGKARKAKPPSYTKNTNGVSWTLTCELPSGNETAAVFRVQTRSKSQCDAFANELAQNMDMTIGLATYFQESAYYNMRNPPGYLTVNYYDSGYDFIIGSSNYELTWVETNRETIEEALAIFPVDIPEAAEFRYEGEGWHSFIVHQYIEGGFMYDGTLRVQYASDGNVYSVEDYLYNYAYYGEVAILSPEEAYSQLKAVRFYDDEYYEKVQPTAITVTQCVLAYQIDTKGFFRPVYIFGLESPDGAYRSQVMIPAMK